MSEEVKLDHMILWNAVSKPPKEALKTIKGGRLSGMTDINPMWRLRVMTEVYGPVGEGWWYTVDGFDKHDLTGETALLARITLFVKGREHGIPGVGGSLLVAGEKSGLRLNDEAWKMAVTDALSVAMKALGVGAEIYMGNWDGSKYRETEPTKTQDDPAKTIAKSNVRPNAGAGDELSEERKDAIADTAIAIRESIGNGDDYKVLELYESISDLEEKRFMWSLLESKERSYIKQVGKSAQKSEPRTGSQSLSSGAKVTLRAAMDRGQITEKMLFDLTGFTIDDLPFAKFHETMELIKG